MYATKTNETVPTESVPLWTLTDFMETVEARSAFAMDAMDGMDGMDGGRGLLGDVVDEREDGSGGVVLDVVKVDTEGHDPAVIRGMNTTDTAWHPYARPCTPLHTLAHPRSHPRAHPCTPLAHPLLTLAHPYKVLRASSRINGSECWCLSTITKVCGKRGQRAPHL